MAGANLVRRFLVVGSTATVLLLGSWGLPRVGLGQAANPNAPAVPTDLLKAQPFDKITLIDGTVLLVDPVSPRPLPPYDPTKEAEKKKEESESRGKGKRPKPPPEGNVFLPGKGPKDKMPEEDFSELTIHWLNKEEGDFKIKRASIKSIEYFEDLLLAEGDRLVVVREHPKAFEHYLMVKLRNPEWKGLSPRLDKLLYEEGTSALLLDNDRERGMRLLRELHDRRPDYPGLTDKLARAYAARIDAAYSKRVYYLGRRVLHELEAFAPDHELTRQWREQFIARARGTLEQAERRKGAERLDLITEAVRTWPELEGLAQKYEEAFKALSTLDVAVVDIPRPFGPWLHAPADERAVGLSYLPVLAAPDEDAARGKRPGQLAAGLEATDLGHRLVLKLKEGVAWSDASRSVGAADVARALSDRAVPTARGFQARWSEMLERVEVTDEHQLEIRLNRALLKPEAWLLVPVGPAHAAFDGMVPTSDGGRMTVVDGPFRFDAATDESVTYLPNPRNSAGSPPKIQRIREVRLPDSRAAIGALVRGEVSLVERIPPDRVAALAKVPGIKVGFYERPSLHSIAIDGRNLALRNRTLRRGLSYALDRKTLLEDQLLHRPIDAENAPSDGPFAKRSYADAPDVRPLEYDPLLARMLIAAARKELGVGAIKLTFEYPATPEAQAVAPKIAEALRAAGVEIKEVERPESALESELRSGRRFDLAYRTTRPTEPAWEAGPVICPGYDAPPATDGLAAISSPRTLQVLLQLERAQEWPEARNLVVALDRESRDELPILPLWQIEDHYAWRTRLKGPEAKADRLYTSIDTWEVEPWIAKDPWSASR